MSLLFVDGFDNLGSNDLGSKWEILGLQNGRGANLVGGPTASRLGVGQYYEAQYVNFNTGSGGTMTKTLSASAQTQLIAGFAFTGAVIRPADSGIMSFGDGTTAWVRLDLTSLGLLKIYVNGVLQGTGTTVLVNNAWYYIEVKAVFSATAGSVQVRLNGGAEITTATNLNTGTGSRFLGIGFVYNVATQTGTFYYGYDDLYVCNALGSVNNDFLGDVRVVGLLPNGVGAGGTTFTKIGASATNWQSVDEVPLTGDTDYVASSVAGTAETYTFADLPGTVTSVLAVVSEPVARKDDVAARTMTSHVRSHGEADYAGAATVLSTTYTVYEHIMETDPTTSAAWTVADVNAAEFGPKVVA